MKTTIFKIEITRNELQYNKWWVKWLTLRNENEISFLLDYLSLKLVWINLIIHSKMNVKTKNVGMSLF